jgi:hypothetical protein
VGEPDADAIAAAALDTPGVTGLNGGPALEFAAYLPGRRVAGVRLPGDRVEVHLTARYGADLSRLADAVRAAVSPVASGLPVEVHIEDLDLEDAAFIGSPGAARA